MKVVLSLACRLCLGLIFVCAGLTKVAQPGEFAESIQNYQVLSQHWSRQTALFLPWLEVVVGLGVLTGFLTRASALLAGMLSTGFAAFVVSALVRGLNVDCGCFSGASKVSWLHLVLDLVLIGLSVHMLRVGGGEHSVDSIVGLEPQDDAPTPAKIRALGLLTGIVMLVANLAVLTLTNTSSPSSLSSKTPQVVFSKPPLLLDPPLVDLGMVKQEDESHAVVSYTNVSHETTRILKVESSCGCTVAKPSKEDLAPGETGQLSITFRPGSNRGTSHQVVRISVEGLPEPIMLQVEAEIDPMVGVEPGVVELEIGKPVRIKLVGHRDGIVCAVQRVMSPNKALQVKTIPGSPGEMPQLEAVLADHLPPPPDGAEVWTVPIVLDRTSCVLYVKEKKTP